LFVDNQDMKRKQNGRATWLALALLCAAGCGGTPSTMQMQTDCNGTFTVNGTAMTACTWGVNPQGTIINGNVKAGSGLPSVYLQTNMAGTGSFQTATPNNGDTCQYDTTDGKGWNALDGGSNGHVMASCTINISQLSATAISFTASGTLVEYDKTSDPLNPATIQFSAMGALDM
jgi:hypothetical protein